MKIKNARIVTMDCTNYESGYIVTENEKIIEIGNMSDYKENVDEEVIIDAQGGLVIPGLIDAHCHLGINVEDIGIIGDESNEVGKQIAP